MDSDIAIRVEGLGKKYVIGHQSAERGGTLRDALMRGANNFSRMGKAMLRGAPMVTGDEVEDFWALRDVNLEIKRGDVVGVIGRNGAGKSTLLKVLSRITEPTTGRVQINGRVASLLEVGTGFHPELSGRENIFLNGAILGMSQVAIRRMFDEIVAFAEVEKFLDTPVKRYSSGMYVRLAFAVAAHLESEILLVDEVLAVGDAQFQTKCLGKMEDTSKGGRTIIFISHNEVAIRRLCTVGVFLENGTVRHTGQIDEVFKNYRAERQAYGFSDSRRLHKSDSVRIVNASLLDDGLASADFASGAQPSLMVEIEVSDALSFSFEALLRDANSSAVMFAPLGLSSGFREHFCPGMHRLSMRLLLPALAEGKYSIDLIVSDPGVETFEYLEEGLVFSVLPSPNSLTGWTFRQSRGQGSIILDIADIRITSCAK